jgi:hypothetical protein
MTVRGYHLLDAVRRWFPGAGQGDPVQHAALMTALNDLAENLSDPGTVARIAGDLNIACVLGLGLPLCDVSVIDVRTHRLHPQITAVLWAGIDRMECRRHLDDPSWSRAPGPADSAPTGLAYYTPNVECDDCEDLAREFGLEPRWYFNLTALDQDRVWADLWRQWTQPPPGQGSRPRI